MDNFIPNDMELMNDVIKLLELFETENLEDLQAFYTTVYCLFKFEISKKQKDIIFYVCGAYDLATKFLDIKSDGKIAQFIDYIYSQIKSVSPKQESKILTDFISTVSRSFSPNAFVAFFEKGMQNAETDLISFFDFSFIVKTPYDLIKNYISTILRWKIDQRNFEKIFNILHLETKNIMMNFNKNPFFFIVRPEIIAIASISIALENLNLNFYKIFGVNESHFFYDFLLPNYNKGNVHSKVVEVTNIIKENFPHIIRKLSIDISDEVLNENPQFFPLEIPCLVECCCPPPPLKMLDELVTDKDANSATIFQESENSNKTKEFIKW